MPTDKASIVSRATTRCSCSKQSPSIDFATVTKRLENNIALLDVDIHRVESVTGPACVHGAINDASGHVVCQPVKRGIITKSRPITDNDYPEDVRALLKRDAATTVTLIKQSDFDAGTYRITKPGTYRLGEHIKFEPNPRNRGMPTDEQRTSGLYQAKAYLLGFFAAITIETTNVVLDLGGYTIEQTLLHQRQQRFYAHIELSSTPFPHKAGPFDAGVPKPACDNIIIRNGELGRSAHHAIHGNQCKNVVIEKLVISGPEVAALSINGGQNVVVRHIRVLDIGSSMFNSALSQAIFARIVLNKIAKRSPRATFPFRSGSKTVYQVLKALERDIELATKGPRYAPQYMQTATGRSDCNAYGFVFAGTGVHVGKARSEPTDSHNSEIIIHDVDIGRVHTRPVEILAHACSGTTPAPEGGGYGAPRTVGPFGDVLNIIPSLDAEGFYVGTTLLDAQMVIAGLGKGPEERGGTNICDKLLDWGRGIKALDRKTDVYLRGGDSMGHEMKGNYGLFFPRAQNVTIAHVTIREVINHSINGGQGSSAHGVGIGADTRTLSK